MEQYFNIRYEFDKAEVHSSIAQHVKDGKPGYICVADGVVLNVAQRDKAYMKVMQERCLPFATVLSMSLIDKMGIEQ